ncbi:MAG: hypothetical protein RBU30_17680 [Polyangia bacterium]|nr:hypothetical protein [Polyangia bacterium]
MNDQLEEFSVVELLELQDMVQNRPHGDMSDGEAELSAAITDRLDSLSPAQLGRAHLEALRDFYNKVRLLRCMPKARLDQMENQLREVERMISKGDGGAQ